MIIIIIIISISVIMIIVISITIIIIIIMIIITVIIISSSSSSSMFYVSFVSGWACPTWSAASASAARRWPADGLLARELTVHGCLS